MTAPLPTRSATLPAVLAASARPADGADHATNRRQLLRRAGALAPAARRCAPAGPGWLRQHDIEAYRADKPVRDLGHSSLWFGWQ